MDGGKVIERHQSNTKQRERGNKDKMRLAAKVDTWLKKTSRTNRKP